MAQVIEWAVPQISDVEARTVELVDRVWSSCNRDEWPDHDRPAKFVTRELGSLCIYGDGLAALRALVRLHAADSRSTGWTAETLEGVVLDALLEHDGEGAAVAADIMSAVATTTGRTWTVVAPAPMVSLPDGVDRLRVGACEYLRELPDDLAVPDRDRRSVGDRLDSSVVAIEVLATDPRAVETVAMQQLQLSNAVLSLATGGRQRRRPEILLRHNDAGWVSTSESVPDPLLLPWRVLDTSVPGRPEWRPGWAELVDAVGRTQRSQWEDRVVVAVVWLDRMKRAWLAGEAVVAGFAALEALILPPGAGRKKGKQLAEWLSSMARLPDFTDEEQRAWLVSLYGRGRSAAIHDGRSVDQDLDVDRLVDVVDHVVTHWGLRHLVASHRRDGRTCVTIEEALDEVAHRR